MRRKAKTQNVIRGGQPGSGSSSGSGMTDDGRREHPSAGKALRQPGCAPPSGGGSPADAGIADDGQAAPAGYEGLKLACPRLPAEMIILCRLLNRSVAGRFATTLPDQGTKGNTT